MVAASSNPITGIDPPFVSLAAAAATGDGNAILFSRPKNNISMQVVYTGGPSAVVATLQGTIDGSHWFTLATFDTGASKASGDIVSVTNVFVLQARASLGTLTGGTAPKVTATILSGGVPQW